MFVNIVYGSISDPLYTHKVIIGVAGKHLQLANTLGF